MFYYIGVTGAVSYTQTAGNGNNEFIETFYLRMEGPSDLKKIVGLSFRDRFKSMLLMQLLHHLL